MPNLPISQLPEIFSISPTTEFVAEYSGTTYKLKTPALSSGRIFGSFSSLNDQGVTSTTTAYSMSADTVDAAQGISVVDGCKFTVTNTGHYNIQFSAQFIKDSGGGAETIAIWLSINNQNVPNTSTELTLANNSVYVVAAWNFVVALNAGSYFELKWHSSSLNIRMENLPEKTSPTRPAVPSVIITVTQV